MIQTALHCWTWTHLVLSASGRRMSFYRWNILTYGTSSVESLFNLRRHKNVSVIGNKAISKPSSFYIVCYRWYVFIAIVFAGWLVSSIQNLKNLQQLWNAILRDNSDSMSKTSYFRLLNDLSRIPWSPNKDLTQFYNHWDYIIHVIQLATAKCDSTTCHYVKDTWKYTIQQRSSTRILENIPYNREELRILKTQKTHTNKINYSKNHSTNIYWNAISAKILDIYLAMAEWYLTI